MKALVLSLVAAGFALSAQAQYLETFSTPSKGYLINLVDDFTGVNWTLSPWATAGGLRDTADYFQTTAPGVLEGIDFDEPITWESPLLDTSAANPVSLSVALTWAGFDTDTMLDPCSDTSLDYIKVQYSVNGGSYTTVPNLEGGAACATVGYLFGSTPPANGSTTVAVPGITGGSTLRVRIIGHFNQNAEVMTIDNVSVPEVVIVTPVELMQFSVD